MRDRLDPATGLCAPPQDTRQEHESGKSALAVPGVPAPNGEQAAVNFLNEPLRQGAGEATVTPRNNGTTGLLWLEPGSLGESTAQTWQYKDFPGPGGEEAALAFLNAAPRQGPGEASGFVRSDGSAVIFYLEPGSG